MSEELAQEVEKKEEKVSPLSMSTLTGDLRDALLSRAKHFSKPWEMMTEEEQHELANGLNSFSEDLVRRVVALFSDHKFPRAVVKLEEVKIGPKLVGKITAENISVYRDALGENVGALCQLVMVDSETFMGERAPVTIDKNQGALPFDAEDGLELEADAEDDADFEDLTPEDAAKSSAYVEAEAEAVVAPKPKRARKAKAPPEDAPRKPSFTRDPLFDDMPPVAVEDMA